MLWPLIRKRILLVLVKKASGTFTKARQHTTSACGELAHFMLCIDENFFMYYVGGDDTNEGAKKRQTFGSSSHLALAPLQFSQELFLSCLLLAFFMLLSFR